MAMIGSLARFAYAQEPASKVELAWTAPSVCPDRAAVEREIYVLLQGSMAPRNAVAARAAVTRVGDRWHVDLAIRTGQGSGERAFEASSCAELGSAVALIVALTVDPSRRAPEAASAPAAPLGAGTSVDASAPVATGAARSGETGARAAPDGRPTGTASSGEGSNNGNRTAANGDNVRLAVGAELVGDVGALPSASVGAAVSLALLLGRARLEARGRLLPSQRALDPARPAQGVDLGLLGGGARACVAVGAKALAIAPCAGLEIDRIAGAGLGIDARADAPTEGGSSARSGSGVWASLEPGLLVTWAPLRVLALRLDADLLVPLARPAFVVLRPDGGVAGVLHRPSPLGGRLALGVEARFF